ncbi:MAG: hypothetical protein KDA42_14275, partial [Planctomycetales bacterium]|nr:hypothetical protein [Planctomycetales bacterium]
MMARTMILALLAGVLAVTVQASDPRSELVPLPPVDEQPSSIQLVSAVENNAQATPQRPGSTRLFHSSRRTRRAVEQIAPPQPTAPLP